MMKKFGLWLAFAFLLTVGLKAQGQVSKSKIQKENINQQIQASTLIKTGDKAPDFTVTMLNGKRYTLSQLKGKVVLLNFWATWCPPCMREFAAIPEKIIKPLDENKNFVFLPISRGEKKEAVSAKMKQLKNRGIDFNVGLDPDKKIYSKYAKMFIPRNFLIDQNGNVVYYSVGYSPKEMSDLVAKIHQLLLK